MTVPATATAEMKGRDVSEAAHVVVEAERCEGFGFCEEAAPEIFQLGEEGEVSVLMAEVPPELRGKTEEAIRACPVAALRLATHDE